MVQEKHTRCTGHHEDARTPPGEGPRSQLLASEGLLGGKGCLQPEEVLEIIKGEHANLRRLLQRLESDATRLLASPVPNPHARRATRDLALSLCAAMAEHVQLENQILLPVLRGTDAWGPVRAEQLFDEHAQQLLFLSAYTDMLASDDMSCQAIAVASWRLVRTLREDMASEEGGVLAGGLELNDGIHTDTETG